MKIVEEHNGFKRNQIVIEQKQLARIIYIEVDDYMAAKYEKDINHVRLGLIGDDGIEFASSSTMTEMLQPISGFQNSVLERFKKN